MTQVLHNRYVIRQELGQGGMGEVFLAEDTTLPGRLVALKVNTVADAATQRQFQREALLLARLHHPNLPRVSDYFRATDGRQFLVMDYIRGENLQQRLNESRRPMSEQEVLACARQLLRTLDYLHNWRDPETNIPQPVVHRDIKPANIKKMSDGRYMLLDFGIAKAAAGEATAVSARALTPGYAPIEQYEGGTDARSDIYSLGATLYALLSGKTPPSATGLAMGRPLPPLRGRHRNTSPRLAAVIERAMAMHSEDRYQTAAAMYVALFDERLRIRPAATTAVDLGSSDRRDDFRSHTVWQKLRRNRGSTLAALLVTLGLIWIAGSFFWMLSTDMSLVGSTGDTSMSTPLVPWENATPIVATPPPAAALAPDTPTTTATSTATAAATPSPTSTATSSVTPDLAATEAADEARILAVLATRDTLATLNAPAPTPTATSTPVPPSVPTNTPIPRPLPTNTPAHCATEPQGPFLALWRKYQAQLGCPLEPWPIGGLWAEQPFQNGHMFWSENAKLYLATVGGDQGWWLRYVDDRTIWNESMPELNCQVDAPSGLVMPKKGFGAIWCGDPNLRSQIGFATDIERGFGDSVDFYHPFTNGAIFRDSDGNSRRLAYVLFGDGSYVREGY